MANSSCLPLELNMVIVTVTVVMVDFTSSGSLIPFTRADAQWIIRGLN